MSTSKKPNGKHCHHCGIELVGNQTRWCKPAHKQAYRRANKVRNGDGTNENEPVQRGNSLAVLQNERDRAIALYDGIKPERDRLIVERDVLAGKVNELERENGKLQGQLSAERDQIQARASELEHEQMQAKTSELEREQMQARAFELERDKERLETKVAKLESQKTTPTTPSSQLPVWAIPVAVGLLLIGILLIVAFFILL